jgi:hypothetical protein
MSIKRLLAAALVASVALGSMGCAGKSCVEVCEESKGCPNASERDKAMDCVKFCADGAALWKEMDCTSESKSLASCAAQQDVCAEKLEGCDEEAKSMAACYLLYCSRNSSSPHCQWGGE